MSIIFARKYLLNINLCEMAITKKKCSNVGSYIFIVFSSLTIPICFLGLCTFPNTVVVYGLHYDGVNQNSQVIEIIDHFKTYVSLDRRPFDNLQEYNKSQSTDTFIKERDGSENGNETHRLICKKPDLFCKNDLIHLNQSYI